jgi:hypothetical protein
MWKSVEAHMTQHQTPTFVELSWSLKFASTFGAFLNDVPSQKGWPTFIQISLSLKLASTFGTFPSWRDPPLSKLSICVIWYNSDI